MSREVIVYSRHGITLRERDVSQAPSTLNELEKLGLITTLGTVIDGHTVAGLDESWLGTILGLT